MPKLLVAVLAAGVLCAVAQENPAATHISADDILATIANAPEGRVSDQQIRHIDTGGHNVGLGVVHRPPTTSLGAIQHHNQTEVYYVVSGRGTLVTGGELTDANALDPEGNTVRNLTGAQLDGQHRRRAEQGHRARGHGDHPDQLAARVQRDHRGHHLHRGARRSGAAGGAEIGGIQP